MLGIWLLCVYVYICICVCIRTHTHVSIQTRIFTRDVFFTTTHFGTLALKSEEEGSSVILLLEIVISSPLLLAPYSFSVVRGRELSLLAE